MQTNHDGHAPATIAVTLRDPKIVEFVHTHRVDVEALLVSLLPHLEHWSAAAVPQEPSRDPHGDHGDRQLASAVMSEVQRALEASTHDLGIQHAAAIGQLKLDLSAELRELHTKASQNSSLKGARSEQRIMNTLIKNYPSLDIADTSKELHCCDIRVTFDDFITLVENKDYSSKNIPRKEVDKFLSDLKFHGASGVLFSQSSGIANKHNFQLDIVSDTTVALYVSHADHEPSIVVAAVDILRNVTTLLRTHKSAGTQGIRITEEQLRGISAELNTYNDKVAQVRQLVTKFEKDLMATLGAIEFRVTTGMVHGGADAFAQPPCSAPHVPEPHKTVTCGICHREFKCKGALTKHVNNMHQAE